MASRPLVAIVGCTASGKSDLALRLAKRYDGEIICADSQTVYRGLDIGTAKPSRHDQQSVPHYLLDVVTPDQQFTVAEFQKRCNKYIDDIQARGKLPVLVGGSGLYIDAVLFNYRLRPAADPALRQELEKKSVDELTAMCRERSIALPENYKNKRYLLRAIETGGLDHGDKELRPNTCVIGIDLSKEALKRRIEQRAELMFASGVAEEANLAAARYGWGAPGLQGNIYPILRQLQAGEIDVDEAKRRFVIADRRLAKKQRTWFRRNPHIAWVETPQQAIDTVEHFLDH